MNSRDDGKATVVVNELGPGRVYVRIADPRPEPDRVETLIRLTIDAWFSDHPSFVIDRAEPIARNGELEGVHVWYHVEEGEESPAAPAQTDQATPMPIEVNDLVREKMRKEHVEALYDEAIQIWNTRACQDQNQDGCLILINSRRIAVIVDGRAKRVAVVTVEAMYYFVDPASRRELDTWLKALPTRVHILEARGSWFAFEEGRLREIDKYDTNEVHPNMTYDAQPRPEREDGEESSSSD